MKTTSTKDQKRKQPKKIKMKTTSKKMENKDDLKKNKKKLNRM